MDPKASASTIARLEARVARLEELLAERSRALRDLARNACPADLEVLSRTAAGPPQQTPSRALLPRAAPPLTTSDLTEADISLIGPILKRVMWADRSTRERIQQYGANVVPVDFYSNTPSIAEIVNSYEYTEQEPPYLTESLFDRPSLTRTLAELTRYSPEFDPPLDGDEDHCSAFFWRNTQFSYSDAMAYYCFIRMLRPKAVVEIGGGFSTLVAADAIRRNGSGTVICVEPFPRPFLEGGNGVALRRLRAQEIDAEFLNQSLEDGDILFLDSTHTVKTGSDCLHIYLRLIPRIRRNIYIHVHDVFLPFGLPIQWMLDKQIFWTEQYLLLALISDNPKARVLYGSAYHHWVNRKQLDELMKGRYPSGGASFWLEYNGRDAGHGAEGTDTSRGTAR